MGLWEHIKDIMVIPDEDDEDIADDFDDIREENDKKSERVQNTKKSESTPRLIKSKTATMHNQSQMQVVLVKPERFDDVTGIADYLNEGKTVVLNLETADGSVSRRIVDFLSGVAYANHGNIRKVANNTFIIVARDVDVMGELMPEDYDDKLYY